MPRITIDLTDEQARQLQALGGLYEEESAEVVAGQLLATATEKAYALYLKQFDPAELGESVPYDRADLERRFEEIIAQFEREREATSAAANPEAA